MSNGMDKIRWDSGLETGFALTDGRHASLVWLYNDHVRYLESGVSLVSLQNSFRTLITELRVHFAEDCEFIEKIGYSRADAFIADHLEIIAFIDGIGRTNLDREGLRALNPLIHTWIRTHADWGRDVGREIDLDRCKSFMVIKRRPAAGRQERVA